MEKDLDEWNEKVKSMHSNWYRDRKKLKSYYKTKMVSNAQQENLHKVDASALLAGELVFEGIDVDKDEIFECVLQNTDGPVI